MKDQIEKLLIEMAIKIVKENLGCLFVIVENKFDFSLLIENDIKPFSVFEHSRRIEALGRIDGGVLVDLNGMVIAYSAQILNSKTFKGYGTRHGAAYTASLNNNIAICGSQEDKKIRIFKDGAIVMQLDVLEKGIEYKANYAVNILENMGIGGMATIATATASPAFYNSIFGLSQTTPLGLAILPGIVVFGSIGYIIRLLAKMKR